MKKVSQTNHDRSSVFSEAPDLEHRALVFVKEEIRMSEKKKHHLLPYLSPMGACAYALGTSIGWAP